MSTSSANINGKPQSFSANQKNLDEPTYLPTLKTHLEEDYDHYKNFLVNGNNANADRSHATSQSLQKWEEMWGRTNNVAKDKQVKPKI